MSSGNKDVFDALPSEAIEYIQTVVKKIKYRKAIRQDVKEELIAHFNDAIRNCQTQEQKKQVCEKLIAEFGEPAILAKLTRRAKKRCRPLWKKVFIKIFQTVGILILLLILYTGWLFTGKPVITTNYVEVANKVVIPHQDIDPNLNAEAYYMSASEEMDKIRNTDEKYFSIFRERTKDVNQAQINIIKNKLAEVNDILELAVAGSRKPYYWSDYDTVEDLVEITNESDFIAMRKVYYCLCWRARINFAQEMYDDSIDDLITVYRIGKHFTGKKTLIEQLVGMAFRVNSVNVMTELAAKGQDNKKFITELKKRISQEVNSDSFKFYFYFDKLFVYAELQKCFIVDELLPGHLYIKKVKGIGFYCGTEYDNTGLMKYIAMAFTQPSKEKALSEIDGFYSRIKELSNNSPFYNHSCSIDIDKEFADKYRTNPFLYILAPALVRVSITAWRVKTDTAGRVAILAVLEYRNKFGTLPDSLADVVKAGLLDELPIDAFSDKPLVYRKDGNDFTLYSVGLNFVDDNGVSGEYKDEGSRHRRPRIWLDDGDAVFWPLQ